MDISAPGNHSATPDPREDADLQELQDELDEEFADPQPEADQVLIEQLAKERDEARELMLRAVADLQNVRRRMQQEKDELRRYATESLVSSLLPVLDNFERSIASLEAGADVNIVLEGIKMIDRDLRQVLGSVKLDRIASVGQTFDPEHHEAIALEATNDVAPGTIVEELLPGYKLSGKTIRPAQVKVAKSP